MVYCVVSNDTDCSSDGCHSEIRDMQEQISEYKQKIVEAKNKYHEALVLNLKKDMKLEQLQKQLNQSQYDEFIGVISDEAIVKLKGIDCCEKKDSFFILTAVKDLYRNDLSRLKQITYSGRRKNPMTPEKKKVLSDLLEKRMANNHDSTRMKNLGKHVKSSIENIVSRLK